MGRIGETLRKARELRDIDLREISDATKISIRFLEAIEENRFDVLPGGVFNKGFIRAYANYIGLDSQAIVDNYVHDIEACPDDSAEAELHPAGLHRPAEIPLRRAAAADPAAVEPATKVVAPAGTDATRLPPTGFVSGVPIAMHDGKDVPPPARGPNTLSRVIWLVAATGLLFCIMAVWKSMVDAPPAAVEAEQPRLPEPSSAAPQPGTDAGGTTALAAMGTTIPDESPPAGGKVAVPLPSHSSPSPEPPPPDNSPPDVPETGPQGMMLTITARIATRVRVVCDGREAVNREMRGGEVESLRCEKLIRLSAPDASSIRLIINGSECQPLGKPGSRLFGYKIRADDYRTLCPEQMEGTDVTR